MKAGNSLLNFPASNYHFTAFFSKVSLKRENPDAGRTLLSTASREEVDEQKQIAQIEKALADAEAALNDKMGDDLKKAKKKIEEQEKRAHGCAQAARKAPG